MIRETRHVLAAALDGKRLDQAVSDACTVSRGEARRRIEAGGVWVQGQRVRVQSRPVRSGQEIRVYVAVPPEPEVPDLGPSAVVLRHRGLVVVNKPAGVHAQAARHRYRGTLPDLVARLLPGSDPEPLHRLDRDTSGLVMLGLDRSTRSHVGRLMAEGRIGKRYLALVSLGAELPDEGTWDDPLALDPHHIGGVRVLASGLPSMTRFQVVQRAGAVALLALVPRTGRMHQLRVHCAFHGVPILGDPRYGTAPAPRMCLHAGALRLPREVTGAEKVLEAPLPDDFAEVMTQVGMGSPEDYRSTTQEILAKTCHESGSSQPTCPPR